MSIDYRVNDADNHYYEPTDAFTRYIEPSMAKRCMQWAEIDGRTRLLVGGRINRFIPNPTFDPIAKPGALMAFYQGADDSGRDIKELFGELEPIRAEYRDPAARLAVMDEQGIETCWMFPTLAVGMEEALIGDPEAAVAAFGAFNRWLADDWGYSHADRIISPPYLSLVDIDAAVAELDRVLDEGARAILMRPAPVETPSGQMSPFLERFDPFWARVNEAGVVVTFHGGDSGYDRFVRAWEPDAEYVSFFATPLERVMMGSRPISDTMAALISHRLFERHPRIRVASIENGSGWVRGLLKRLDRAAAQSPGWFKERPSETFHRHVWVSPFWEDHPIRAAETIGVDRTLFGSDWPHTEGLSDPVSYADQIAELPDDAVRAIMRDNFAELTRPLS